MLEQNGYRYLPLGKDCINKPIDDLSHSSWLGTSQCQDAKETIKALSGSFCDWLIVDHYALDERWEKPIHAVCNKLMVIDDLADRQHDCDMLLDQNYFSNMKTRYSEKVPRDCQLLLGPT